LKHFTESSGETSQFEVNIGCISKYVLFQSHFPELNAIIAQRDYIT